MNTSTRGLLVSLVASLLVSAVACGSTSSGTPGGGGDAATDGTSPDGTNADGATDAGTELFPSDTTKIVVTESGGNGIAAPDGSTCSLVDRTFTLLLPARELSWKLCEPTDAGPYAYTTGMATITAGDFVGLSNALRALRRATKTSCGADKPVEIIVLTTPAGDTTYEDDFYFCDASDTKAYVRGLDDVLVELRSLAK